MRTAVVDVGGGMRGIYAAGVLDYCMDHEITFDLGVGVSAGKLKTLAVFPSIFKGEHVRHGEMVEVLTGRNIRVEFDRPTPLQIDGETIPNVTSYEVTGGVLQ